VEQVNWLLARGYGVITKEFSTARARKLAKRVHEWRDDPAFVGRQVGWLPIEEEPEDYVRPMRHLLLRLPNDDGKWEYAALLVSLRLEQVVSVCQQMGIELPPSPDCLLLAAVRLYDLRGGGIETSFREDKQGLGITKRGKKRFEAQRMLRLLGSLAHNLVIWARSWLAQTCETLQQYGIVRLVRDLFHVSGFLRFNRHGRLKKVALNQAAPLAKLIAEPLRQLLARSQHCRYFGPNLGCK